MTQQWGPSGPDGPDSRPPGQRPPGPQLPPTRPGNPAPTRQFPVPGQANAPGTPPNQPSNQPPPQRPYQPPPGTPTPDPTRVQPAWNQPDWQQPSWQQSPIPPVNPGQSSPANPGQSSPANPGYSGPAAPGWRPAPPSGGPVWQQGNPQGAPAWQQNPTPPAKKRGPLLAVGLLVAVVVAAVVTIVVINNQDQEPAAGATPPAAAESTAMTGRSIGARSLPAPVPAEGSSSTPSTSTPSTTSGSSASATVSPRPGTSTSSGSGSSSTTSSPDPAPNPQAGLVVGGCVAIADIDGADGVSLAPLDCSDQDATYLVQADGYDPCDEYELTLNSPEDQDRALCLDFNVEEGDCLTVGADGPLGDQIQDCGEVQNGGLTYEVLSVQDGTSDIQDCPGDTEVALPNVTRDRLVCLNTL